MIPNVFWTDPLRQGVALQIADEFVIVLGKKQNVLLKEEGL